MEEAAHVRLRMFDVKGRVVRGLIDGVREPGRHVTVWDGLDELGRIMPPGVYFCRLESGALIRMKRVVLVK